MLGSSLTFCYICILKAGEQGIGNVGARDHALQGLSQWQSSFLHLLSTHVMLTFSSIIIFNFSELY